MIARSEELNDPILAGKKYAQENGLGIAGSVALHALAALILLFVWTKAEAPLQQTVTRFLPVDVVQLGDQTASPPEQQRSAVPQQRAAHIPVPQSASPRPPVGVAPSKKPPPVDEFQAKLRALARLHEPDAPLQSLDNSADSDVDSTSADAAAGDEAMYSIRDFVRAQVERRWSLNLASLGSRRLVVLLHVEMTRAGVITEADIVDKARYTTDATFKDIALSARNAVLLASPIALPPGHYRDVMDMTLKLNPRDTLR